MANNLSQKFTALLIASLALPTIYAADMDIIGTDDTLVKGGSIKLTPVNGNGGFYIITDDDKNGNVELKDWDGNVLSNGLYTAEIRGSTGNFVRATEVRIAGKNVYYRTIDGEVFARSTDTQEPSEGGGISPVALVVGGVVVAGAAIGLSGSSSDDSGGGDNSANNEPLTDTTNTSAAGDVVCQVSRDEKEHAEEIGTIGGGSDLRINSGSMQLNMPISGAIAYFTGSFSGGNFTVNEFATIAGHTNTEMIATGRYATSTGAIDFSLTIGANGALGDTSGQIGVDYACSGSLTITQ